MFNVMFDFAQERGEKALSEQDHVRKTADMMLLKELFRELEFEFALEHEVELKFEADELLWDEKSTARMMKGW